MKYEDFKKSIRSKMKENCRLSDEQLSIVYSDMNSGAYGQVVDVCELVSEVQDTTYTAYEILDLFIDSETEEALEVIITTECYYDTLFITRSVYDEIKDDKDYVLDENLRVLEDASIEEIKKLIIDNDLEHGFVERIQERLGIEDFADGYIVKNKGVKQKGGAV